MNRFVRNRDAVSVEITSDETAELHDHGERQRDALRLGTRPGAEVASCEGDMNEHGLMAGVGLFLIIGGFLMTEIRGAMPGASQGRPATFRERLITIVFGLLMFVLGTYRLIYW
jgi:hypothetical protein